MGPKIDLKRLGDQLVVRHQQMGAGQDNCHGSRLYTEKNTIFFRKATQEELSKWDKYLQDTELEAH